MNFYTILPSSLVKSKWMIIDPRCSFQFYYEENASICLKCFKPCKIVVGHTELWFNMVAELLVQNLAQWSNTRT